MKVKGYIKSPQRAGRCRGTRGVGGARLVFDAHAFRIGTNAGLPSLRPHELCAAAAIALDGDRTPGDG